MHSLFIDSGAGDGSDLAETSSILRIARVMRILRTARIAKLVRYVPELVILLKGMMSVSWHGEVLFPMCFSCLSKHMLGFYHFSASVEVLRCSALSTNARLVDQSSSRWYSLFWSPMYSA